MRSCRFSFVRLRALLRVVAGAAGLVLATGAAAINVTAGQNLNLIMENATAGDLILVGPGTYVVEATPYVPADYFRIRKAITVRSTNGPGSTTLQAAGGATGYAVYFHAMTWNGTTHSPSGATLEGFTIIGAKGGVEVQDYQNVAGGVINNITLKNLVINPDSTTPNGSHGISFQNVTNSRIDTCTVVDAYNNGIYVFSGSNNLLTSNLVQATVTQHAIALSNTTGAIVAGNTITDSAFHGIIALGTTNSRIERNTISGHRYDGITVTNNTATATLSSSNFIGHNNITSDGWATGVDVDGTGIFLNGDANGNLVFGNNLRGSPENGVALFASSFNYLEANRIHGNYHGGILIWKNISISGGVGGTPTNNLVRNNFIYYNPTNAMVNLRDTVGTDIAFNYLSGANFPGEPTNPTNGSGGSGPFTSSPGGVSTVNPYPAASTSVYGNSIIGMTNSIYFDTGVTNASVYRNRFFGTMNQYANVPAQVNWDAGPVLGGNFWTGHAANGNPSSGATPYTNIYCPGPTGCTYKDNYPFAAESLGQAYSVSVNLPRLGSAVAAGSMKTIGWESKGCTLVDIDLMSGVTPVLAIAANYPDVGYFIWNVPSGQAAGSYTVRVTCKNSAGASVGTTGAGGAFTVFAAGLKLLSPGPFATPTASATMVVSWARGAGVTGGVNVFISVDGGAETNLASGVTGNSVLVTVPIANSNRVVVRIVTGTMQDSTDGYFSIVRTTGFGLTGITTGQNFAYGSKLKLEWKSYPGARYVDIELFNGSYQLIAQNVADFGHYDWLVDNDFIGSNRNIRVTYKSTTTQPAPGLAQATSSNFNVVAGTDLSITQSPAPGTGNVGKDLVFTLTVSNGGPAAATNVVVTDTLPAGSAFVWASPGCANAAGTVTCNVGSLASGTNTALKVVVRPASVGVATNNASVTASEADPSMGNNSTALGVTINSTPAGIAVLRYRLYSDVTKEHHFTTDLNEYNVLGTYVGTWVQEGTVGKVLNNPGTFNGVTAVPYYRLYDNSTQWHHWTTDANEYYTLIQFPWWNGEGVDGYILPTNTTGAIQLYRLLYPFIPGLHHWTIDTNEYSVLTSTYGWIGEGGSGFVIQ